MYGRFYGFALDNRWIGHVTRTKHRDTRLEYRASESKSIKCVERKGLAWKHGWRTPKELVVAHITMKRPIQEEANHYNKQQMQHFLLRQENRYDHMEACMTWQLWCNATYHKIKRNQNSDTHIYSSSCFSTAQIKCWLAWQNKAWVSYTKLNEVGKSYLAYPNYSICLLIRCNETIMSRHDVRCKQVYKWHIQIVHIFLIKIHI
jgi:hypothetical protein